MNLVSQTHAAAGFRTQINSDAQKVSRASSFTPLAADTILSTRRRRNLTGLTTVPGHHFKNVSGTSPNALCTTDTGIVNFDRMRHCNRGSNVNGTFKDVRHSGAALKQRPGTNKQQGFSNLDF